MEKGDGCPSPLVEISGMWISPFLPAVAQAPLLLVVHFLLVEDVPAGSTNRRSNRRALSSAEQRSSHRADAGAGRRASNRFAGGILAIVITTVIITSVIVAVVVPG